MADRVYPEAGNVANWYASKSNAVSSAGEVSIGTHIGPASAGGVTSDVTAWADYTAVHRIDNPSDGINDSADYVVYFRKEGTDPVELWKATNADSSTLVKLESGTEYDNFYDYTS